MIQISAVADIIPSVFTENIPIKNIAAEPLTPISVKVNEGITELIKYVKEIHMTAIEKDKLTSKKFSKR